MHPPKLEGNFRVAENNELVGWVIDPDQPERRIELMLMVDGDERARVPVGLPRPDLTTRLAHTEVGFSVNLDPLKPRQAAEIRLVDCATQAAVPPDRIRLAPPPKARVAPVFHPQAGAASDLVLRETRHGWMLLNTRDAGVDKTLLDLGEYAESELQVMARLLPPNSDVIEAGANIGALALPLSRLIDPEARVIAIEPQIGVFSRLNTTLALNAVGNVVPVLAAVGDREGRAQVPFLDERRHHSSGGVRVDLASVGQPVPLTTIDALRDLFGEGRPTGLIKIDVEGAEQAVFDGALATIRANRPSIYAEVRERDAYALMRSVLDPLGYQVFWHAADLYRADNYNENAHDHYAGQGVNSNVILAPPERAAALQGLSDPYLVPAGDAEEFWPPERFPERIRPRIHAWQEAG